MSILEQNDTEEIKMVRRKRNFLVDSKHNENMPSDS